MLYTIIIYRNIIKYLVHCRDSHVLERRIININRSYLIGRPFMFVAKKPGNHS